MTPAEIAAGIALAEYLIKLYIRLQESKTPANDNAAAFQRIETSISRLNATIAAKPII